MRIYAHIIKNIDFNQLIEGVVTRITGTEEDW